MNDITTAPTPSSEIGSVQSGEALNRRDDLTLYMDSQAVEGVLEDFSDEALQDAFGGSGRSEVHTILAKISEDACGYSEVWGSASAQYGSLYARPLQHGRFSMTIGTSGTGQGTGAPVAVIHDLWGFLDYLDAWGHGAQEAVWVNSLNTPRRAHMHAYMTVLMPANFLAALDHGLEHGQFSVAAVEGWFSAWVAQPNMKQPTDRAALTLMAHWLFRKALDAGTRQAPA